MKNHTRYLRDIAYLLGIALLSAGCTFIDGEKSSEEAESASRGPAGIELAQPRREASEFPAGSYEDGPEVDDSRASLRAIQEADIVQVVGDRLYAISAVSGLAIIDISEQDELRLLGTYRTEATPFEMYVRGDRVIAMFKQVPQKNDDGYTVAWDSQVISLDVADPKAIEELESFDLDGRIVDSRIVDSILYVAAHTVGAAPSTTILSLDISAADKIEEVDRLSFDEVNQNWNDLGWSERSIVTTDDRMYVSGPSDESHSVIQVIDISDTSGDMELGAELEVDGAIFSRWQIDEYEGVLRVISQPPDSYYEYPPTVQTFTINSSDDITDLASLELVLPRAELLRSVRFDEDRAYAITYEKTDPLFVIDLSDPSAPLQAGELEVPGFVFHMEPRGDRLLGLGFEPGNEEGGLHVSLFDVSDMTQPSMIERVNFGPTWSSNSSFNNGDVLALVEDRNRLHKSFKVLDDLGLILVPFSGWTEKEVGCGKLKTGIQLVDFTEDSLTMRATVGATGTARRAFIHEERMFAFSEDRVQTFNIDDRDKPVRTADLPLALRVHRTAVLGDRVLRIGSEWNQRVAYADVVDLDDVASPELGPYIDLASLVHEDDESCEYHDDGPFAEAPLFSFFDRHVALPVVHEDPESGNMVTDLIVLDTEGDAPSEVAKLRLDYEPINTGLGAGIIQIDSSTLVFQRPGDDVNDDGTMQNIVLEVIDLSDPTGPVVVKSLERPFALGTTGLHLRGDLLSSGYYSYEGDFIEYFLDRVDVSEQWEPSAQSRVAFPGLSLGPIANDYLSLDFGWRYEEDVSESDCQDDGGEYDEAQEVCWFATRELLRVSVTQKDGTDQASIEGRVSLTDDVSYSNVHIGDDTYFLSGEADYDSFVSVVQTDGTGLTKSDVDLGYSTPTSFAVQDDALYVLTNYRTMKIEMIAGEASMSYLQYAGGQHLTLTEESAIVSRGNYGVTVIELKKD